MNNKESDVIGREGSVITFRSRGRISMQSVGLNSVRERESLAYRTGHRFQVGIWLPMAAINANGRLQSIILYVGQMRNRPPRNEIVAAGKF